MLKACLWNMGYPAGKTLITLGLDSHCFPRSQAMPGKSGWGRARGWGGWAQPSIRRPAPPACPLLSIMDTALPLRKWSQLCFLLESVYQVREKTCLKVVTLVNSWNEDSIRKLMSPERGNCWGIAIVVHLGSYRCQDVLLSNVKGPQELGEAEWVPWKWL